VRAERYWRRAEGVTERALAVGALVPLATRKVSLPSLRPFVLRKLEGAPPRHLVEEGPKPNPFLPWEPPLEIGRLTSSHALILNKFPVQPCHLLLITQQWHPQEGWLTVEDWRAVAHVGRDTGGLWFFNSGPTAGASQPHRHLQLLPRHGGGASCPLAPLLLSQLRGETASWPWRYALSRRWDPLEGGDLPALYRRHAAQLDLGDADGPGQPRHAYNLLFDDEWFLTVRRVKEHCAGFSVNALGFAGFLLCTLRSDLAWLERNGPWKLLAEVAEPSP
jgi:ATP adenylyltransferase